MNNTLSIPLFLGLLLFMFLQTDYFESKRGALRPLSRQVRDPEYPSIPEDEAKIPRRLIFTYHSKILEDRAPKHLYKNVMHTINTYRKAWNDMDAPVWFLDDQDCLEVIEEVEPRLAIQFRKEKRGEFKADICRLAALYTRGGYYFDIDMKTIQAVPVPDTSAFASVRAWYGGFFQSFLASAPESPIIKKALVHLRDYYEQKESLLSDYENFSLSVPDFVARHEGKLQWKVPHTVSTIEESISARIKFRDAFQEQIGLMHLGISNLVGPGSLRVAYEEVISDDKEEASSISKENTLMLEEVFLQQDMYPGIARQPERKGKACNFIVHSPEKEEVYFYSRMVGVPHCPL